MDSYVWLTIFGVLFILGLAMLYAGWKVTLVILAILIWALWKSWKKSSKPEPEPGPDYKDW